MAGGSEDALEDSIEAKAFLPQHIADSSVENRTQFVAKLVILKDALKRLLKKNISMLEIKLPMPKIGLPPHFQILLRAHFCRP